MNLKRKMSKRTGITLISLVVTIIVLLILAGISISMLSGDNGILRQADNARKKQSHEEVKTAIAFAYNEYQINKKTSNNNKIASTSLKTIQGIKINNLATEAINTSTFMNFLKAKKYIDDKGIVNVEILTGAQQALGNGENYDDVYVITQDDDAYFLKYYKEQLVSEIIYSISADVEVDWEEVFEYAKKPEEQEASGDVGVDSYGNAVNMDYWYASIITRGNGQGIISLSTNGTGSSPEQFDGPAYVGPIDEEGKITGKMPAYVKKFNSDEFLPVTDLNGTFYQCEELKIAPKIPITVTNMNFAFYECTNLEKAPEIPISVEQMSYTFCGCVKLTGKLIINSKSLSFSRGCLLGASTDPDCNLILSGNSEILQEIYYQKSKNSNITIESKN